MGEKRRSASRNANLTGLIESRALRMMKTGYRGYDLFSQDARDALVAAILTTWTVDTSRREGSQRREQLRRDRTVAGLRKFAVADSDWLVWGRDYYLPWRPLYALEAEYEFRKASLDIVADAQGVRNRNTAMAMQCWSAISIGAEVVRITGERLDSIDGSPALDESLRELTRAALDLAAACVQISETPRRMTETEARRTVALNLADRPTMEIEWLSLVEQLDGLIGRCTDQLETRGKDTSFEVW